ncbi:MAG TPA: DUF6675 family protein [Gammaproteobacteria bacterium]|nr:DUF6675 family protein [Gammaproteobacteria bacterium]
MGSALAQNAPVPPCAGSPVPSAGAVGAALNQLVWMADEVPADWSPPACTGWSAGATTVLLAAAGRFTLVGDSEEIAAKVAAFSNLTDIVYWSSTRDTWRQLFKAAFALSGPDRTARRADFTADDFVPDAELYYWVEEDNPTSGLVYQMLVHERTADRLVFESVNRTAVKAKLLFLPFKLAEPGEFRQRYIIERENGDIWRYYSLVRLGEASNLAGTSATNYRNRAEAYFRYLAGLRMDREPPAAR